MKIQDIFTYALLVLAGIWLFRLYNAPTTQQAADIANKTFIAPELAEFAEPLQLDVDFQDVLTSDQPRESIEEVNTQYGAWFFSNYGAAVKQIIYQHGANGKLDIIRSFDQDERNNIRPFLVAFDGLGATPFFYKLVDRKATEDATMLSYLAETEQVSIEKQFVIYHERYQLDVNLSLTAKDAAVHTKVRLFIPAPTATDERGLAGLSAVFYNEDGVVESKPMANIGRFGKLDPTIFGIQSHYFIHTLAEDTNNFARRGYYRVANDDAMAVLQTPLIEGNKTWHLSFYCGPKESQALMAVSDNLEDIVSYGWFSPLSKGMLSLLNMFYRLFNSYGFAIILLSALINLFLLPFRWSGQKKDGLSESEKQKKLQYIEQKYKHDQDRLNKERFEFTRKHAGFGNMNPWVIFLQLPLFIALNRLLSNAFELYQAPFLWIPNLSSQDPYYILPMIVGFSIVLPSILQSANAKTVVGYGIGGIVASAIFSVFTTGLLLFIWVSALFSSLQNYLQKRFK